MVEFPIPCREAFFSISATLFSVVEDWYFVSCAATRGLKVSGRKVLVRPGHLGDSSKSPGVYDAGSFQCYRTRYAFHQSALGFRRAGIHV